MSVKDLAVASGMLLGISMTSGCGVNHRLSLSAQQRPVTRRVTTDGKSSIDTANLNSEWVMPNRLPSSAQTTYERLAWPIYNTQLAINQFPVLWHGKDLINTWKLPPKWIPYLYKNEKHALTLGHSGTKTIPLTLYITLQGTVFLYPQTISETQWPGTQTVGDIPPATIVAEFVPLKAAVQAGIIPENRMEPVSLGHVFPVWQKILGMTSAQILRAIQS